MRDCQISWHSIGDCPRAAPVIFKNFTSFPFSRSDERSQRHLFIEGCVCGASSARRGSPSPAHSASTFSEEGRGGPYAAELAIDTGTIGVRSASQLRCARMPSTKSAVEAADLLPQARTALRTASTLRALHDR